MRLLVPIVLTEVQTGVKGTFTTFTREKHGRAVLTSQNRHLKHSLKKKVGGILTLWRLYCKIHSQKQRWKAVTHLYLTSHPHNPHTNSQ